ncbi:hypothetical protein ACNPQM_21800 [Streptomyces sp. NPDC056231]|uniref:hypothetical protein n=1 Tax=Streptomyces sp. NPDC056231 TaxID=3345755 RepID=UPI003AAE46C0
MLARDRAVVAAGTGVEPGGFTQGTVFVNTLFAVGDDKGDESTSSSDDAEGQLDHVEEGAGCQHGPGFDPADAQDLCERPEDASCDDNRADKDECQGAADGP